MFFTFQRVSFSLYSAFREFINDVFPLHTHRHTQTHTLIFVSYVALDFVYQQIYTAFPSRIH